MPTAGNAVEPAVALYGQFGTNNLGNDASMVAMIELVRRNFPDVGIETISEEPDEVRALYGIPGRRMRWAATRRFGSPVAEILIRKLAAKVVDPVRTFGLVRRYRAVVVPGMGVFEGLGSGTWGAPYGLFLLVLAGRILRRPVLFVSVGADPVPAGGLARRFTRWTVRHATYLSYRDDHSQRAHAGIRVPDAPIRPDLAFGLATPPPRPVGTPPIVYVGVMRYFGMADDPAAGEDIRASYLAKITDFVVMLLEQGYAVRVGIGDRADSETAEYVAAAAAERVAPQDAARVSWCAPTTYTELLDELDAATTVVATRFHNVVFSLMLGKPTVSIGYGIKNAEVMTACGQAAYCQHIDRFDLDLLVKQFRRLEGDRPAETIGEHVAVMRRGLAEQEAEICTMLSAAMHRP